MNIIVIDALITVLTIIYKLRVLLKIGIAAAPADETFRINE